MCCRQQAHSAVAFPLPRHRLRASLEGKPISPAPIQLLFYVEVERSKDYMNWISLNSKGVCVI
jgi:hypothetical protein